MAAPKKKATPKKRAAPKKSTKPRKPRSGDFKPGNRYCSLRKRAGMALMYPDPVALVEECVAYFEWVEANPLQEPRAAHHMGEFVKGKLEKPRPFTLKGLCLYLGMDITSWENYRKREGFVEGCAWVENVIWAQKFEGAAADLFNVQIIARDLGLADRQDITSGGKVIKNEWHVHPTTTAPSAEQDDGEG